MENFQPAMSKISLIFGYTQQLFLYMENIPVM